MKWFLENQSVACLDFWKGVWSLLLVWCSLEFLQDFSYDFVNKPGTHENEMNKQQEVQ